MKRKLLLLFVTLLLMQMYATAQGITEQDALIKAQQFMPNRIFHQTQAIKKHAPSKRAQNYKPFYVFNAEQHGGFVIVSGDERTEPILGYADKGNIDMENLPENISSWFCFYEEEISSLNNNARSMARSLLRPRIDPLIKTHWGQGQPYNSQCPYDGDTRSATGCVATAMAQIMYYHRCPASATTSIPAYTTTKKSIYMPELPPVIFRWDEMKSDYEWGETGMAAEAVSELMLYCGQSAVMDYTAGSSGSRMYPDAFVEYFGYAKTAKIMMRYNFDRSFSNSGWEELIYNEINSGRPVLYCGNKLLSDGHMFIVDGYDGAGYFHVNWGWSGESDGYFLLSVLNPDETKLMANKQNGYTANQGALIGLQPDNGQEEYPEVYVLNQNAQLNNCERVYSRDNVNTNFKDVELKSSIFANSNSRICFVDHQWALYSTDGDQISQFGMETNLDLHCPWVDVSCKADFGAGLADGTYIIRQLYRETGTSDWQICLRGFTMFIVATISNNILTLQRINEIEDLGIQINSCSLSENIKVGRSMSLEISLTNLGYTTKQDWYLWNEENNKIVGGIVTYLDHLETATATIYYKPDKAGETALRLTTDYDGNNTVWSETISVGESYPHTMTGTIELEGAINNEVNTTYIDATITLKNGNEYTYDDDVIIVLYPYENDDMISPSGEKINQVFKIMLSPSNEQTLKVHYDNLCINQKYNLAAYYYYNGGWLNNAKSYRFKVTDPYASNIEKKYTKEEETNPPIYYNLSGQRVNDLRKSKGLYIVNGNKIILK